MPDSERLRRTREFFGPKAPGWDAKFGDDMPAYARAVAESGLRAGGVVADVGCGTGRALPALREAVGAAGTVVALDATPEMLQVARERGRARGALLAVADALRLPLADACVDAVFAAGLIMHLPDPADGLRELARVTRAPGRLALFHPSGRAALAARHGREPAADEPLADAVLPDLLRRTGWALVAYDDAEHRFFALAERRTR
jgi:ubiquinone/menaquinone biosynthesis C-methylase UbiE